MHGGTLFSNQGNVTPAKGYSISVSTLVPPDSASASNSSTIRPITHHMWYETFNLIVTVYTSGRVLFSAKGCFAGRVNVEFKQDNPLNDETIMKRTIYYLCNAGLFESKSIIETMQGKLNEMSNTACEAAILFMIACKSEANSDVHEYDPNGWVIEEDVNADKCLQRLCTLLGTYKDDEVYLVNAEDRSCMEMHDNWHRNSMV